LTPIGTKAPSDFHDTSASKALKAEKRQLELYNYYDDDNNKTVLTDARCDTVSSFHIYTQIGEEKVAAVSRLFFFSFVATFDNFCPSVRPSVRPSVPTGFKKTKILLFLVFWLKCVRGLSLTSFNKKPITRNVLDGEYLTAERESTP
jgi:hypothetical protein